MRQYGPDWDRHVRLCLAVTVTLHSCYHDNTQLVHVHLQHEMQQQHGVHVLDSLHELTCALQLCKILSV